MNKYICSTPDMSDVQKLIDMIKGKHGSCRADVYAYKTWFTYGPQDRVCKVGNETLAEFSSGGKIPLTIKNILK